MVIYKLFTRFLMRNFDSLTCSTGLGMRCVSFLMTSFFRLGFGTLYKIGVFLAAKIYQTAPCIKAGSGPAKSSARFPGRVEGPERQIGDSKMNHVSGEKKAEVTLYALSTCIWCKKAKNVLNKLGVEYSYIDLDLLEREEQIQALSRLATLNPSLSLPTLVINENVIIGDDEERIYELLA
jgi:glutaredoxin-like protein NrdH